MEGSGNDNIGKNDFEMFGQMEKDEYLKTAAPRLRLGDNSVPSEIIELCKLLQISTSSKHHIIVDKYNEVINKWEPSRFLNDPDKYFSAQQVCQQLKEAYGKAKDALGQDANTTATIGVCDLSSSLVLNIGSGRVVNSSGSKGVESSSAKLGREPKQVDFHVYPKEELWRRAYNIQYKGHRDDLPEAVCIYKFIVNNYHSSDEATYAKTQLDLLKVVDISQTSNDLAVIDQLVKSKTWDFSTSERYTCDRMSNTSIESIPTHAGLASLAFIVGFGLLGGLALGSHFTTKRLIAKGDYDGALKASSNTYWNSMIIIIGVPMLAILMFSSIK